MKPPALLEKYYSKRIAAIDGILQKPPGKFTENDFHDLRVEIKKLRALIDLLNFCAPHFKKKLHSIPSS